MILGTGLKVKTNHMPPTKEIHKTKDDSYKAKEWAKMYQSDKIKKERG